MNPCILKLAVAATAAFALALSSGVNAQCYKGINGLFPLVPLPPTKAMFDRYTRCSNGQATGPELTCRPGFVFSVAFQRCVESKFMVALDNTALAQASSAGPAQSTCTKSLDDVDPSIYYTTCGGLKLKSQCDKGLAFSLEADACIPNLGAGGENQGKDYAERGYKRLDPISLADRSAVPCSFISSVFDDFLANGTKKVAKFVVDVDLGAGKSADFAFEVLSASRGNAKFKKGFTSAASLQVFSVTSIDELDINGDKKPGFQVPNVFSPTLKSAGDISKDPKCAFSVDYPVMLKKLYKLQATPPTAASIEPAVSNQCIAVGAVGGAACAGTVLCAVLSFGLCAGPAIGVCGGAATGITSACTSGSGSSCFPADATVQLSDGSSKRMHQLALGDKVLTKSASGSYAFSDVYLQGHNDSLSYSRFVSLTLTTQHRLQLSPGHFIPTVLVDGTCAATRSCKILMKRAQDVKVGDFVWAQDAGANGFMPSAVASIEYERKRGLFNPFTLSGDLVVNGVLASAHSDWFLEQMSFPDKHAHHIPRIYQTVMAPARFAYHIGGASMVQYVDSALGVVDKLSFY